MIGVDQKSWNCYEIQDMGTKMKIITNTKWGGTGGPRF